MADMLERLLDLERRVKFLETHATNSDCINGELNKTEKRLNKTLRSIIGRIQTLARGIRRIEKSLGIPPILIALFVGCSEDEPLPIPIIVNMWEINQVADTTFFGELRTAFVFDTYDVWPVEGVIAGNHPDFRFSLEELRVFRLPWEHGWQAGKGKDQLTKPIKGYTFMLVPCDDKIGLKLSRRWRPQSYSGDRVSEYGKVQDGYAARCGWNTP